MASAAPAQPLPLPSARPVLGPLDIMLASAAEATGGTHPDAVVGAAQTASSPDEAVGNAQAIASYTSHANAAAYLKTQSRANQEQIYNSFSPSEQEGVKAAGYTPIGQGGGVLGAIERGAMSAYHAVGPAINDVTNALGAPLRAEQHFERTMIAGGAVGPSWLVSPSDWAQSWNETTTGQTSVIPQFKQIALAKYGPATYALAYKLATGQTAQSIIQATPAAQQQQVGQQLNSPQVQEATSYLNAGHYSLGRYFGDALTGGTHTTGTGAQQWISAGIDGLMDWFGDPFVIGAKIGQARLAMRYMVSTPESVDRLFDDGGMIGHNVRAAARDLTDHIAAAQNGDISAMRSLLERYPRLGNSGALAQLRGSEVDTVDKLRDYWKSVVGTQNLLLGKPVHASEFPSLPHLSYTGVLRLGVKEGLLRHTVNFADEGAHTMMLGGENVAGGPLTAGADRLVVGGGRFARSALRLLPTSRIINVGDPNFLTNVRDIAAMTLSQQDADRVIDAASRATTMATRDNIISSLNLDLGRAAGVDRDPEMWARYVEKYGTQAQKFAPDGEDIIIDAATGQPVHMGLFESDFTNTRAIPSFRDLYTDFKKGGITHAVLGAGNTDFLDRMMSYWRPLTLARLGFATRVGGEEALGFMLREGPLNYLRGVATELAYKAQQRAASAIAEEGEQALASDARSVIRVDHGRLFNMLSRGLDSKTIANSNSILDLFAHSLANSVHGAMEATGKALSPLAYKATIDRAIAMGAVDDDSRLSGFVTAMHGGYDSDQALPEGVAQIKDQSGKLHNMELVGQGEWRGYNAGSGNMVGEGQYQLAYQRFLHKLASSDWGRAAMDYTRPKAEVVDNLAQRLLDDPKWEEEGQRSGQALGKWVGDGPGEISRRAAANDHAAKIYNVAWKMTHSPADNSLLRVATTDGDETLVDYLRREGKAPPWWASKALVAEGHPAQLSAMRLEDLPKDVPGPEMVPSLNNSGLRKITNWMWRKVISPQINMISRKPMYWHNLTESLEQTKYLPADLAWDVSNDRAFDLTVPYVHNPELRSQMSTVTRNLAPFWFAQEQFYKRWARNFVFSPWAFRQLQLISHSLANIGFIHTDPENGQQYFVYPLSAAAVTVVSHVLQAFGIKDEIPVAGDLTGYVSMLNPGIERGFLPNFGPVVDVPLDGLKTIDVHMNKALGTKLNGFFDALQGSDASAGYLSAVLPATVLRIAEAADPSAINPGQYASAQMSAIQYLEATGNGLGYPALRQVGTGTPPNTGHFVPGDYFNDNGTFWVYQPGGHFADNSPQAMQAYLSRVNNWARVFFSFRMLYGFAGPASPENYFNPKGMSAELETLMNSMPYQQAMAAFLSLHPDATAMTVFQTQNTTGGFLPATASALDFINANPQMFHGDNSAGATYLIPTQDTTGKFDVNAYTEELSQALRVQKAPANYWTEIAFQSAANVYYGVDNYKDQMLATHAAPSAQIDQEWTRFSAQFMLANPLFAQMYTDTGAITRERIMSDVGNLLADPATPETTLTAETKILYQAYHNWQSEAGNYGQPNAPSSSQAYEYNVQFAHWLSNYVAEHPSVQPLVNRVIAPMLESTLTDMAAQGTALTV